MAIYDTSRPVPFGATTTLRVVNFFDAAISNFRAWSDARKTTKILNGLSRQQLEDIGLCSNVKSTSYIISTGRFN